jgi:hypothetical protein
MRRTVRLVIVTTAVTFAFVGCQSHKARVDALQKEYDQLANQFHQDCSAEYLKIPPTISEKCNQEDKNVKGAWNHLQAERAKQ